MSRQPLIEMVDKYEAVARELEIAARHCRIAANHLKQREIPRACAHGFAAEGRVSRATRELNEIAEDHAQHSVAE